MISVNCHFCNEPFEGGSIRDVMESRRFHEEQHHREGKIETDTSTQY